MTRKPTPLVDAEARHRIRTALDDSLIVQLSFLGASASKSLKQKKCSQEK